MKNDNLLDAFGLINEDFIEEADPEKKRASNQSKNKNRNAWIRWGTMAACAIVVVGISIPMLNKSGITGGKGDSVLEGNIDEPQMGGITEGLHEEGNIPEQEEVRPAVTEDSAGVIQNGNPSEEENSKSEEPSAGSNIESDTGAPLAPEQKDMTKEEIYNQMGMYLPENGPDGFAFEEAYYVGQGFHIRWANGMDELEWVIRNYIEEDAQLVTSVSDIENYDLSLYPIPRAQSVPDELRQIVNNPIFRIEELTQDVVNARAYLSEEEGDSEGYRMKFSVLYGEKVITITAKGVSPEWVYTNISGLVQ